MLTSLVLDDWVHGFAEEGHTARDCIAQPYAAVHAPLTPIVYQMFLNLAFSIGKFVRSSPLVVLMTMLW